MSELNFRSGYPVAPGDAVVALRYRGGHAAVFRGPVVDLLGIKRLQ